MRRDLGKKTMWFSVGGTIVGAFAEWLVSRTDDTNCLPRLDISYEYLASDPQLIHIFADIGTLVPAGKQARIPYLGMIHSMDKLVGFKNTLVQSSCVQLNDRVRGYNIYISVTNSIRRFLAELHDDRTYDVRTIVLIEKHMRLLTAIVSSYYAAIHSITQDGRLQYL
jgi:hypothetical protein